MTTARRETNTTALPNGLSVGSAISVLGWFFLSDGGFWLDSASPRRGIPVLISTVRAAHWPRSDPTPTSPGVKLVDLIDREVLVPASTRVIERPNALRFDEYSVYSGTASPEITPYRVLETRAMTEARTKGSANWIADHVKTSISIQALCKQELCRDVTGM